LQVKAKLLEGAAACERRAQVNKALAEKLREVIEALQ
jgi:stress-induced morphogen